MTLESAPLARGRRGCRDSRSAGAPLPTARPRLTPVHPVSSVLPVIPSHGLTSAVMPSHGLCSLPVAFELAAGVTPLASFPSTAGVTPLVVGGPVASPSTAGVTPLVLGGMFISSITTSSPPAALLLGGGGGVGRTGGERTLDPFLVNLVTTGAWPSTGVMGGTGLVGGSGGLVGGGGTAAVGVPPLESALYRQEYPRSVRLFHLLLPQ